MVRLEEFPIQLIRDCGSRAVFLSGLSSWEWCTLSLVGVEYSSSFLEHISPYYLDGSRMFCASQYNNMIREGDKLLVKWEINL